MSGRSSARRRLTISLLALGSALAPLRAQGGRDLTAVGSIIPPYPEQFTPEVALDLNRYSIGDMTDDGLWLAVTMTVRRDDFGIDFRRDGDPTYVHPTPTRLWIVDGTTRIRTELFPDKRGIRAPRFSPDGKQLAMLLWTGELYEPAIYDRASKKVATLHLPADRYVAESSDLRWTSDGKSLVFAVHTVEWRKKAQASFKEMTAGPVFVQSAKSPFLVWDDLRRDANWRSIGALDTKTGLYHELVPETMISSYTVADDGSAVTYAEDLTKATSYEELPADTRLTTRSVATGAKRTLFSSTRGVTVVWADDGKRYAFVSDGRVFTASLDDTVAKPLVSGSGSDSYTVSRFSPRGDALLVANPEGMWVVDLATSTKELAIAVGDSTAGAPRVDVVAWSDDGTKLYFTTSSRTQWERAVVLYDRSAKQLRQLVKDGRTYADFRLSKNGTRAFLTVAEGKQAGGDLCRQRRAWGAPPLHRQQPADGRHKVRHHRAAALRGRRRPKGERGGAVPTQLRARQTLLHRVRPVRGARR